MNDLSETFDILIAGGGPAGMSAALWSDDLGLTSLIVECESELGGQLLRTHNPIENYIGLEAANGRELRDRFLAQISSRSRIQRIRARISGFVGDPLRFRLSDGREISGRAVVIATGVRRRILGIPGEKEFAGRGVIDSGKRHEHEVAGKRVVIVGGGDAALENALILSSAGADVILVHRRSSFSARDEFVSAAMNSGSVSVFTDSRLISIDGAAKVESVVIESSGQRVIEAADFVLVRIGVEPNTELFKDIVESDESGYLAVDRECRSSVAGVFAAGDCANPISPTVSTATGMGATAAKAIYRWLNESQAL